MKVDCLILGGGVIGRMVQRMVGGDSLILEWKSEPIEKKLSNSYGTNYLWEPIPEVFETVPVQIITRIDGQLPSEESIRRYKNKIGKGDEKVAEWGLQFMPECVGYFITRYPDCNIKYDQLVKSINLTQKSLRTETDEFEYSRLVSTIPLNVLTTLAGLDMAYPVKTIFKFKPVYVRVVDKPPEAEYSDKVVYVNYLSNPLTEPYRYCDRFGERHYESLTPIGFPHKKLYPGKIWSDPSIGEILDQLKNHDVFCFGRYGSWFPNELIHETYKRVDAWRDQKCLAI